MLNLNLILTGDTYTKLK